MSATIGTYGSGLVHTPAITTCPWSFAAPTQTVVIPGRPTHSITTSYRGSSGSDSGSTVRVAPNSSAA